MKTCRRCFSVMCWECFWHEYEECKDDDAFYESATPWDRSYVARHIRKYAYEDRGPMLADVAYENAIWAKHEAIRAEAEKEAQEKPC